MSRTLRFLFGAAAVGALAACASGGGAQLTACSFTPAGPRSTAALQQVASDRGLGGSGVSSDDRGLGGSGIRAGIIGVVTGFGSLCVNGYEIDLDERSVVTVEGHPATEADVHLGQLVVIEAEQDARRLRAARVDVRLAAMGPVSTVSDDGKTFTLLGQTVRLADLPGVEVDKVAAGDWVAVSGLRNADTVIEGTSVVRLPQAGARVMVAGPVRASGAAGLQIANLAIGAQAFAPGDAVVVAGRLSNGAMAVDQVRPQLEARFTASVRHLSLQTLSPSDTLMGLRITTSTLRPMTPGAPVQMEGRLTTGNTFVPGRITIPELPRDGQVAVRGVIIDRGVVLRGFNPGDNVGTALVPRPDVRPPERPDITVPETPPISPN